jgi:hypothetical protein
MHWRMKGLLQKTLGVVPGGRQVNDLLQTALGSMRDFDSLLRQKLANWEVLIRLISEAGIPCLQGLRLLEVGTGWFPALPFCFSLGDAASCVTFDVTRHLTSKLTFRMLAGLEPHLVRIALASSTPIEVIRRNYAVLKEERTLPGLLNRARVKYDAPADIAASAVEPASVDLLFSNSVLQYVPIDGLRAIMRKTLSVLRPGGIAVHRIVCSDDYSYFDRSISPINYLVYTERQWRFWNNRLLYQNRLRPKDFCEIAVEAGLCVLLAKFTLRPEAMAALPKLRIAPEFRKYPPEQLCATSFQLALVKQ